MIDEETQVNMEIDPGIVGVNYGIVHRDSELVKALLVDLSTKYAEVSMTSYERGPVVYLEADENALHKTGDKGLTAIDFVDFPDWRIFCCQVSKYVLTVCIIRDKPC